MCVVLKFQLGNHMGTKEKLWGGTAGVFCNWLTFGSIPKGDVTSGRKSDAAARKDDGRSHNARARAQLGRTRGGGGCSVQLAHHQCRSSPSLPPLTPDAPLQPPFPVKIFSRISAKNGSLLLTCSHATRNDLSADSVFLCFM